MDIRTIITLLPGFLAGITIHEAAHALTSKWLGDHFAKRQGRISLNPMRHLSASGTLLLIFVGFGWGKPVPINLYNYKHPRLYCLLSSLAGPLSNILLVIVLLLIGMALELCKCHLEGAVLDTLIYAVIINLFLAFINLIPIPPLDGSAIWPCLIPSLRQVYSGKTMSFWFIVLLLIFVFQIPTKIAAYVGRQMSVFAHQRIEQKRLRLPKGFPEELRVPQGASSVWYDKTGPDAREPNMFTVTYWLDQNYPAIQIREEVSDKIKEMGWEASAEDPNEWNPGGPISINGNLYNTLTWNREWAREEIELWVEIRYFIDPNSEYMSRNAEILYRYTVNGK